MSTTNQSGFTLIETILFLAITGSLILAILAGTGGAINTQRYRDSVATFKADLQSQYSDALNVHNEARTSGFSCDKQAQVKQTGATDQRGQTECVVLGRYVVIDDETMSAYSVVGYKAPSSTKYANDIAELQAYNLSRLDPDVEASTLEWGAQIAWPSSGSGSKSPTTPRILSLLILRSPSSGLVYTFSADSDPVDISTLIIPGIGSTNGLYGQSQRRICIESGAAVAGGLAVFIPAYAAGQSAIEIRTNDMGDASTC